MRIFADPNELREGSTLPEDVAAVATPLPHLEEKTGADLLVSILDIPALSDSLLQRHCDYGVLVQLKRLNDLQSSIVDGRLFRDVLRMREWSPFIWLVVSGVMLHIDGKAINGHVESVRQMPNNMVTANVVGRSGLTYNAVDGALDAFAYYGGYVKHLPDDSLLLAWLQRQAKAMEDIKNNKVTEIMPHHQWRDITGPTKVAWLASLFDGIGQKTAQAVYDKLTELTGEADPPLYSAIAYVTDYGATCIPGITQERVDGWRKFLGLRDAEETHLTPPLYDTLITALRLRETGEVYWHGTGTRWHYRNDERIRPEGINTPYYLRDLLNDGLYALTYLAENEKEQQVTGELLAVWMERKFEFVTVKPVGDAHSVTIRLDKIIKVEKKGEI